MNSKAKKHPTNFWPYAIIAWFVAFVSALAAWTTFAVGQKMDLVRPDYYEEEVRFQNQLDRLNRTTAIRGEVLVQHDAAKREVLLILPASHLGAGLAGRLHFYRPSNASLDFDVPLAVDPRGLQRISTDGLLGGSWKVRAQWTAGGLDYFIERQIVVDGSRAVVRSAGEPRL